MYYKEEVINGVLCFKTTPNGEWKQFTLEQLTNKIVNLKNEVSQLNKELEFVSDAHYKN